MVLTEFWFSVTTVLVIMMFLTWFLLAFEQLFWHMIGSFILKIVLKLAVVYLCTTPMSTTCRNALVFTNAKNVFFLFYLRVWLQSCLSKWSWLLHTLCWFGWNCARSSFAQTGKARPWHWGSGTRVWVPPGPLYALTQLQWGLEEQTSTECLVLIKREGMKTKKCLLTKTWRATKPGPLVVGWGKRREAT